MPSEADRTLVLTSQLTERRGSLAEPQSTDLWETARSLGYPAALWRLPNQQDKHLIVSFDEVLPRVSADLDELPAGFIISPFDNFAPAPDGTSSAARTLFLRADIQVVFAEGGQSVTTPGDVADTFNERAAPFWNKLYTIAQQPVSPKPVSAAPTPLADPEAQSIYVRNVAEAVEAIQRGEMRKVVLARTKRMQFDDAPNAVALFDQLCEKYPTAFVSAVSLPEHGQIWLSATPERLVSVDADGIFRTASLAGTQSATHPTARPNAHRRPCGRRKRLKNRPW